MTPNLREEKKLWKKRYKRVVGLDEAGRGPLSGPVVAAAVLIIGNWKLEIENFKKLRDSKKLSPKKREEFYKLLTKNPNIGWGIGKVSEKVIDKINILEATKLAMEKAVKKLKRKPDFLILDGNFKIDVKIPQKSIIKGDEKVFSCAAASILAKVYRDRIMERYDKKYPLYGFSKHKGYPTKFHLKMLKKYGSCKIHRKTFGPVRKLDFLNKQCKNYKVSNPYRRGVGSPAPFSVKAWGYGRI